MNHPLLEAATLRAIERAVSADLDRTWRVHSTTDLADRSSHPAMLLHGPGVSIFAKLAGQARAAGRVDSELAGLRLIGERAGVAVPTMIAGGRLDLPDGSIVMLFEGLDERFDRDARDWREIGRTLALIHQVAAERFGADRDGFFGPLGQDNRPVTSNQWSDFYATRRVLPQLRTARDAESIDADTVARVETLVQRLDEFVGEEPQPRLLHGDAQHHNFVSTPTGAVVIDTSPYYGHPEIDLALLDYFSPVPEEVWAGYQEIRPIDSGFDERRELWRIFAYLGILTVDAHSAFGRSFRNRLDSALDHYVGATGATLPRH